MTVGDFKIGDDGGASMPGEGGDISDVVVMRVGNADEVHQPPGHRRLATAAGLPVRKGSNTTASY